eukprot:Opistho-2@56579
MSIGTTKSWIAGLFAAFTASLCCIVPLIALLGGAGSASTYFNWVEPYRPYIIGLSVILFALAWYNVLIKRNRQRDDCGCEGEKKGFLRSKKFLLIITVVPALLITFPYYSNLLYAGQNKTVVSGRLPKSLKTVSLSIQGMSCAGCTSHIDGGLHGIGGISSVTTSFEKATTVVSYDVDSISADSISKKIRKIGYRNTIINKD